MFYIYFTSSLFVPFIFFKSVNPFLRIYPSFQGTYYNFISTEVLQTCLSGQLEYLNNQTLHFFGLIFNNITCEYRRINHTLKTDWHISDRQEHCPTGTEVKNVTVIGSNADSIEYYCGKSAKENRILY